MRLLLDTHVLLWAVFEPQKLPSYMQEALANSDNIACISIISLWEIAIKRSIGRLDIPDAFFDKVQKEGGFDLLLVQPSHILPYLALPLHHRDPFDRMLVAQAKTERLVFMTVDEIISQYDVPVLK